MVNEERGGGRPFVTYRDEPIRHEGQDRLSRKRFAERTVEILEQVGQDESSTVVALVGPWGSGKTSLVNLCTAALSDRWRVESFNPWAAVDFSSLIEGFFLALRDALPPDGDGRSVRAALEKYGRAATKGLVGVGGPLGAFGGFVDALRDGEPSVEAQGATLSMLLGELRSPVLMVLDDIDRLQPDELTLVLKAIRVIGRLPYVHYLLAYDERTVLDLLTQSAVALGNEHRALAYLEKLVQVRLECPPTQASQSEAMLNDGLEALLDGHSIVLSDQDQFRLAAAYEAAMQESLTEPRSINRYLGLVEAYLPLLEPSEIDFVDFLIITFLRGTYPSFYRRMARARDELTTVQAREKEAIPLRQVWAERAERESVPPEDAVRLLDLLQQLFPLIDANRACDGLSWHQAMEMRDRKRVASREYFLRYFYFGVPVDELSDALVAAALREICEKQYGPPVTALLKALTGRDERLVTRAIAQMIQATGPGLTASARDLLIWAGVVYTSMNAAAPSLLFTSGDSFTHWLGQLMDLSVANEFDSEEVEEMFTLAGVDENRITLELFVRAVRGLGPNWLEDHGASVEISQLSQLCIEALVKSIEAGDSADPQLAVLTLIDFVHTTRARDLSHRFIDLIGQHADHIAAHFVGRGHLVGPQPKPALTEFDMRLFTEVIGERAVRTIWTQLTDRPAPPDDLDNEDISWANRRIFARRAIRHHLMRDRVDPADY